MTCSLLFQNFNPEEVSYDVRKANYAAGEWSKQDASLPLAVKFTDFVAVQRNGEARSTQTPVSGYFRLDLKW